MAGLRKSRSVLPADQLLVLLNGKFSDPILGIVGAHGILFQAKPDKNLLEEVLKNLEKLVPDHPDLNALRHMAAQHGIETSAPVRPATWPPMFFLSYRGLLVCDAKFDDIAVIAQNSFAETIAPTLLRAGTWTTWWGTEDVIVKLSGVEMSSALLAAVLRVQRCLREAVEIGGAGSLEDLRSPRKVRQIAFATGLPVSMTQRAIRHIDSISIKKGVEAAMVNVIALTQPLDHSAEAGINKEKERVSLGLKQTQKNPWDQIEERFPAGQRIKGKITNLVPYGAFVEIEEGVEGLIHVSELSWTKRIMRPSDILSVGQEVEAVVLGVNKEEQKISLGLRQLEANPWDEIEKKFTIGRQVKGTIRNMTAYGAFVELEEGIDGMIHVSDLSWTRKINHPSEMFKKGDEVEAVVIDIDKVNQRISLGIKQLAEDPWKTIDEKYKIGDLVKGKVTKLASFGAFVQLQDDIDGLVHISQLSEDHVAKVKDVLKVGQEVEARVIKVDKVERRIGLSIKAANYSEEQLRKEVESFDTLRPGEDMVGLEKAFAAAEQEEYRPGESKRATKESSESNGESKKEPRKK